MKIISPISEFKHQIAVAKSMPERELNHKYYVKMKEQNKKLKPFAYTTVTIIATIGLLTQALKTGKGLKHYNKCLQWIDTSSNNFAKFLRFFQKTKLNVNEISPKAYKHLTTSVDNVNGIGSKGISGAHKIGAFINSFFKTEVKDNIQITNLKMKNKEIKDGNIIIEYLENGISKVIETNIGEGLTKGQQKILKSLVEPKNNNGHKIKDFTKTKFYKTYLCDGTNITTKRNRNFYKDIYEKLFTQKLTGQIDSIQSDPFIDGLYNIKYHKLSGGNSFPEKTVYVDKIIGKDSTKYKKLLAICPENVQKSSEFKLLSMGSPYNATDLKTNAEIALRRGVLVDATKQPKIIGKRAGTIFVAYCNKKPNDSYEVKSIFPVLHGSNMHKDLMCEYINRKGKIEIFDIPNIIGLKENINPNIYKKLFRDIALFSAYIILTGGKYITEYEYQKENGIENLNPFFSKIA